MPRMSLPLSAKARRFLEEHRFAVLATINADGTPQQSPVWYELQGDEIMMNTRRGRLKDRNLRRDPRCSICVEGEYDWITIRGTARLIDDPEIAQADIHHLSVINHGPEIAAQQVADQFSREERITIRLSIEDVTGENLEG
jgi:PPOX class probable F420-dependent enzyme